MKCIKKVLQVDPDQRPGAAELERDVRHVQDHVLNARQPHKISCIFDPQTVNTSQLENPLPPVPFPPLFVSSGEETIPDIAVRPPTPPSTAPREDNASISSPSHSTRTSGGRSSCGSQSEMEQQRLEYVYPIQTRAPIRDPRSTILGKPPDAHGILHNPDLQRVTDSALFELDLPSRKKVIAVAMDSRTIAYLTSSVIYLFKNFDRKGVLRIRKRISVLLSNDVADPEWKGIAISGDYVAIWGFEQKSRSSLV
jgi:hypothetical protein